MSDNQIDRKLFEDFANDKETYEFRSLRSTLASRLGPNLALTKALWSCDEILTTETLASAKQGLLRGYQIKYALEFASQSIIGHEEAIKHIFSDLNDRLEKATAYINVVNAWIAQIDKVEPSEIPHQNA